MMGNFVIPAKAGIHTDSVQVANAPGIPAFAGMTGWIAGVTVVA
jgi:hypothetical protein